MRCNPDGSRRCVNDAGVTSDGGTRASAIADADLGADVDTHAHADSDYSAFFVA